MPSPTVTLTPEARERRLRNAVAPAWAARLFTAHLAPVTLQATGEVGVWAADDAGSSAQISAQFTENAGDYHTRYSAAAHFEGLFRQALAKTGIAIPEAPLILDLGSGSGVNSIVPCFNLFPGARQVATDLSGELLGILADHADRTETADRLFCVVLDAMSDCLARRQFDLITGSAILHHLEKPNLALLAAARALKPGGHAIFFEPFDGYGLVRLAYERILAEAALRNAPLEPAVERVLSGMVADITQRTDQDPSKPGFAEMDDKWLFSREVMEIMARDAGFVEVAFVPHNDDPELYLKNTLVQLKLFGDGSLTLPDWAQDILRGFDRAMPRAAKGQLMLEGTVVLTRGEARPAVTAPLAPEA